MSPVRLPWPFGRSTPADGAASGSTDWSGAGASGDRSAPASGPGPSADASIAPTGAWRTLPPIQRTAGPPPVVAPSAPFLAEVPGHVPLPPIVTPLGHDSSPGAPAGIVVAHPHPVPALTSHAQLPTRPVQRRTAATAAVRETWDATETPTMPSPAVDGWRADSAAFDAAVAHAVPAPPEPDPVRMLASVAPAATVTPPARPLTRAPASPQPLPVAAPRPAPGSAPTAPTSVAPPIQRSAAVPASARQAASPKGSPSAPVLPDGAPGTRALELPPRRRFGELPLDAASSTGGASAPRRAGLGAPMTQPPVSAVAQRQPARPGRPPALPDPRPDLASATSEVASATSVPSPSNAPAAPAPRPLPVLPVARSRGASTRAPDSGATSTQAPAARPLTTPRTAGPLPTLGARPLKPAVTAAATAQRSASAAASPASPSEAPAPVAARWSATDDLPATVTTVPSAPTSADDAVPLQRSEAAPAVPMSEPTPATRELWFAAPEAALEAAAAAPWATATPNAPARPSTTASSARTSPPAGRPTTPLTLARTVAPSPTPAASAPAPVIASPPPGSIVAAPAPATQQPVVQTARVGSGVGLPVVTATPIVQRVDGAGAATNAAGIEAGGGSRSEADLDDLARKLFGRFRVQIREEVIHEREAKGLTFDAF